jgi:thiol-disulfide isomerase/thioredoxin
MSQRPPVAFLASLLLAGAAFAQQQTVPATPLQAPGTAPAQQAHPAADPQAKIYDESADARQAIDAALAKAKTENQRVLIQWGGNWCGWCHLLHGLFESDKDVAHELNYEYQVVLVDVGHFDKNIDLATQYKADLKKHGLPYLTVLGADGSVIANQDTGALESKPTEAEPKPQAGHDRAKVLEFLKANRAKALQADAVLADAREKAKASGRKVLVHWGAPWCSWCHRLDNWLAQPQIGAILEKDYVCVKIDEDRMIGGKELLTKEGAGAKVGIPWLAIEDASNGTVLATSEREKGKNIGFPSDPAEIEHFAKMLKTTSTRLSDMDILTVEKSLTYEAAKNHGH